MTLCGCILWSLVECTLLLENCEGVMQVCVGEWATGLRGNWFSVVSLLKTFSRCRVLFQWKSLIRQTSAHRQWSRVSQSTHTQRTPVDMLGQTRNTARLPQTSNSTHLTGLILATAAPWKDNLKRGLHFPFYKRLFWEVRFRKDFNKSISFSFFDQHF